MPALQGRDVCWNHDPLKAAAREAARKSGGRLRLVPVGERPTLKNAADVLREAEDVLWATKALENSARRTTAIVAVLQLALRTIEVGDFADRLDALEKLVGGQQQWTSRVG